MDDKAMSESSGTSSVISYSIDNAKPNEQVRQNLKENIFLDDVITGLSKPSKTLPCKYFYDDAGSQLFEEICQLEEYYITRTEIALLKTINEDLANLIGPDATIIEPGAGAGKKIRLLLAAMKRPRIYVPMDISKELLLLSSQIIQSNFPAIDVQPLLGDFSQQIDWISDDDNQKRIIFFPGSTIGNFEKNIAIDFLANMRQLMGPKGAMIVGIDLVKEHQILEAAYNDNEKVTDAFNKNLLVRINRELNANFDLKQFTHKAIYNQQKQRIEMYLISQISQTISINNHQIDFLANESIHTENSHKYTNASFLDIASKANLSSLKSWQDENNLFAIHYLTAL